MCPPSDEHAREHALDPKRSFVVHAPAGSGKTELLIQRLLLLLARVEYPEQILAITFTRKAAAEMRDRVLDALGYAREPFVAVPPHRARTQMLAAEVLAADAKHGWDLLARPERLRIQTIDALNQWLALNLPVGLESVAGATVVQDGRRYHSLAVQQLFRSLEQDDEVGRCLRHILRHRSNDLGGVARFLADLLPRRDQWLRHLAGAGATELRTELERSLAHLIDESLRACCEQFSAMQLAALADLARHAADHAEHPKSRQQFAVWASHAGALEATADQLGHWQAIAHLLLTDQGSWRKRLGSALGFGAEHEDHRSRLQALLSALSPHASLATQLQRIAELPPPRYSDSQWRILNSLRVVLVRLAAELAVVFGEHRVADFVEVALAAQRALGASEQPSELLLALDRRIEHLLVDEYQDTSHMQHALLALLTAGWEAGDGRTLFLVGDPMQSIYRFRDADVGLFLNAARIRFGQVVCEPLQLSNNFRSAPALVQWVSQVFGRVLPDADDPVSGTARFVGACPQRESTPAQEVQLHAIRDAAQAAEIERVCELVVRERQRDPEQSIAVLVHSRAHLRGLGSALARHGQLVDAVEGDNLARSQLGQDLIGLTRALLHFGDRCAWLGILRAPWCGLRWRDLEILSEGALERTIWEAMQDDVLLTHLSDDGQHRLLSCRAHLRRAIAARGMCSLGEWAEATWRAMGGRECLEGHGDSWRAESFFEELDKLQVGQDLDDPEALAETLTRIQSGSEPPGSAKLQILTIHRAKGLEFDTVVILGLAREPRTGSPGALSWVEFMHSSGHRDLLLAPLVAHSETADKLTRYLWRLEQQKAAAERIRLLYVAVTRARERLHLVARLDPAASAPAPRSLLATLWAEFQPCFGPPAPDQATPDAGGQGLPLPLTRLRVPLSPREPATRAQAFASRPGFDWAGLTAAHVGTVVHRELAVLASLVPDRQSPEWVGIRQRRYARELALLGVNPDAVDAAAVRVVQALQSVLEDPRGRWILGAHREAESEITLQLATAQGVELMRLDRTFVDSGGRRWVIDYKVGVHEGGDLESFLDAEVARYAPQLQRYAETMYLIDARPIELGLYFPLHRRFRYWSAQL